LTSINFRRVYKRDSSWRKRDILRLAMLFSPLGEAVFLRLRLTG